MLLSDKMFHVNNLNCVRSTSLKNGYPLELLNEKIFERYKKLISNQQKTNSVFEVYDIDNQENRKIITFPYVQNFQKQLCRIFKKSKLLLKMHYKTKNFQHLKTKLRKNLNIILFTKLIASNVIKNILDKYVVSYTTDCLNMLDQLKIKKIKLHLQNTLLPISILLILKIQKYWILKIT